MVKNFDNFSALASSELVCFRHKAGVEEADIMLGRREEMKSETSLFSRSSSSVLSRLKNALKYFVQRMNGAQAEEKCSSTAAAQTESIKISLELFGFCSAAYEGFR